MSQTFTRIKINAFLLFFAITLPAILRAQMPVCPDTGGFVYVHTTTNTIANWNPALPLSGTNPVTNTIALPSFATGLAVSPNINSATAPSPTFYTNVSGNYYYYDGTAWVNTGHTAGAVNFGAGGGYIYSLEGGSGQVYKYDGTGNATPLIVVPGFNGGGPYDVVADCAGNFYILKTQAPAWLRKYSPTGTLIQEWSVVGAPSTGAGGGFAIIGNTMYHHNSGLHSGIIGATTVNCTPVTGTFPSPGDFASCPVGGATVIALNDTVFNCVPGAPQTITASGTTPFTYTVISGTATVTGSGPSFNVTNTQPATIVLSSTNTSACSPVVYDTIMIVPAAVIDAGPSDTLYGCGTYLDTLGGSLHNTTSWITYNQSWNPGGVINSGANTPTPVIAPVSDTTFVYTVTTSAAQGGCTWTDSVRIRVKDETVVPDYTFTIVKGCQGDTVLFTNISTQNTSNFWDFADGFTDTTKNPVHFYSNQDIYLVKLTASNYLCTDSIIKIVDTRHPLIAAYTVDNDTICQNTMVHFTGTSTVSAGPGSFFWDFGDGSTSTQLSPSHTYTVPGTYPVMLAVKDAIPCTDTTYYTIVVDSIPQMTFSIDKHNICTGQSVQMTALYTQSGHTGLDWNFGDGSLASNVNPTSHAYETPGTYFITLNSQYRVCNDITRSDSVNVHALPLVYLGPDSALCLDGNPIFIGNLNPGQADDQYRWNTGDTTAMLKVTHDGTYKLLVTNRYDCNAEDDVIIKKDCYIDIPNSFTPNGDGNNDYFFPRQLLSKGVGGFTMKIFNRWGQVVYETSNSTGRGWDGRFNDKEQPTGVYIYQIGVVLKNGRTEQFSGNVTLLR
jgi:gliding motility-associated-like protein